MTVQAQRPMTERADHAPDELTRRVVTTPQRRRGRIALAAVIAISSMLVMFSWAASSPVGSSPDDNYHQASIWCAWGVSTSICESSGVAGERLVPEEAARRACYWRQPESSARCIRAAEHASDLRPVSTANFSQHLYPPVYYAVARSFVTHDVTRSVLLIRWFNGLLFVLVIAIVALLVPGRLRRTMLLSYAVTLVPLGVFIVASVNPSAWAVLSAGTFWVCLYALYESPGPRRWPLVAMSVVTAGIGCAARADVCVYTCIAVGAVGLLQWRRLRRSGLALATSAVVVAMAIGLFLTSRQVQVAATSGGQWRTGSWPHHTPVSTMVFGDVLGLPSLLAGVFGSWGLGWFDVMLPSTVFLFAVGAFCAVVFAGLAQFSIVKVLALSAVTTFLVLVPLLVLVPQFAQVGEAVQPRYLLPLIILFAGLAILPTARELRFSTVQANGLAIALALAHTIALHSALRRYISGSGVSAFDLNLHREWWWSTSVSPMLVWGTASIAFFVGVLAILRMFIDDDPDGRSAPEVPTPVAAG